MKGDKTFWRKNYYSKDGIVIPYKVFRTDFPLEIENFLSPEDCKLLIHYYKSILNVNIVLLKIIFGMVEQFHLMI